MAAIKISKFIADIIKEKLKYKLNDNNNSNKYLTSNSFILSIYYKCGTFLCFIISMCIIYNIFTRDIIYCNDGHGVQDDKLRFALVNFCLSYPQLSNNDEQFVLFYKWVPYIMILLCILFYTPKIIIKYSSCDYTANCLMKLNDDNDDDDDDDDNNKKEILQEKNFLLLEKFIKTRWNKCKSLYFGCLFSHIYTLILNIFLFFLLDFLLQGRFSLYIPQTFPFKRDPLKFSDKMSQRFYPFVRRTIKSDLIQTGRDETLFCHLTLMEYYEKIFFMLWLYLMISSLCVFAYTIFLFSLCRNNYNSFFNYVIKRSLKFNMYLLAKKKDKEKKPCRKYLRH